jgi:monoamine oxidase
VSEPLRGVRVIVAGAGLSGLVTARALSREGASVRIVEARDRIGGCVWTYRDAPIAPSHAELGGEFIDKSHKAIRKLCKELDLRLVRVLRRGFGIAIEQRGRIRVLPKQTPLWKSLTEALEPAAAALEAANRDWRSTAAKVIARRSFREVLDGADVEGPIHALATALRGLFLADPEQLSAIVPVEQTLAGDPGRVPMYRIAGGADRLPEALQKDTRARLDLRHVVRSVEHDRHSVTVTIEGPNQNLARAKVDYFVSCVPTPLLLELAFSPPLADAERGAVESLSYGPATKALLRFTRRWWRRPGRPRAFATNLPIGALWESAEEQDDATALTLMAGGRASAELRDLLNREGALGLRKRLRWLGGGPKETPAVHAVTWEDDPWARGGYAYFSPGFDPGLHHLLSRGAGRVLFAGAHTSREFPGYMNGAVESGLRVASEIVSLERMRALVP